MSRLTRKLGFSEGIALEIEIKVIRKKNYEKAIQFTIKGMHFDWYLDNRFLLNAYGRYFGYLEINRTTQIFAAYADSEFVGVLLAETALYKFFRFFIKKAYNQLHLLYSISVQQNSTKEKIVCYIYSTTEIIL